MAVPEMQKAIAKLRLTLAGIRGKEEELEGLSRQFRRQLERAPSYAVHGGSSLDAALSVMGEIQERLDGVDARRGHLAAIKERALRELQALQLTDRIEHAKAELAALKKRSRTGGGSDKEAGRIGELERFVQEASIRAAESITGETKKLERDAGLSQPPF